MFISKGDVIISGDLNCRTGRLNDFVAFDKAFDFLNEYVACEPFKKDRKNPDITINQYGWKLIELCKTTGLQILNGRMPGTNKYTCHCPNGESVIDYVICSRNSADHINYFRIGDKDLLSAHCALKIGINTRLGDIKYSRADIYREQKPKLMKYQWDHRKLHTYQESLRKKLNSATYEQFVTYAVNDNENSDNLTEDFYRKITPSIKQNFKASKMSHYKRFPKNPWFDEECKWAKSKFHCHRKTLLTVEDRHVYWAMLRQYKSLIQKKKRHYQLKIATDIDQIDKRDPQEYWKYWKKHNKRNYVASHSEITFE